MSRSRIIRTIRILLLVEIVVLICAAIAMTRDYQDGWILEGLEIPFVIFMATNIIYFLVGDDKKWLVLFATLSRFVFALLPNLKYNWFLGTAIDQHVQFRLTRFLLDNGHIEAGGVYSETPIMHVFFASYSEITSVPVLHSFKFLPVVAWAIFPAITYSIMNRIFPEKEKQSLVKYALLISSMPVESYLSYTVVGTLFGSLLAFLTLSQYLGASIANDRRYLVLSIVFGVTLMMSHFVSSVLLMLGFLAILLLNRIKKTFKSSSPYVGFPILFITLELAWIIIQSNTGTAFTGEIGLVVSNFIRGILGMEPKYWDVTGVRPRFFDLNFFDGLRVLTVFHGGDIVVLILAILGIIVAGRVADEVRAHEANKFLILYFLSLWFFVPFQLVLTRGKAGLVQYFRVIRHTLVICPMLAAFSLFYINRKTNRVKSLVLIILSLTFALSTIQMYGYQPLLPPSKSISENLPSDEPVVFLTWIGPNSIYQRSLIYHVEKYASEEMLFASDFVTYNQIVGLADYEFSANQTIEYNPLLRSIDEDVRERDYDIFLIHLPGKAGGLAESAENRTKRLILQTILNSDILYTNGESFALVYSSVANPG